MKMTALILLFVCSAASANFSGEWLGEFKFTNQKGQTFLCDDLTIRINQQVDFVDFGKFSYGCGQFVISFVPPKLSFEGEKILFKNQFNDGEVGTINTDEATVTVIVNEKGGKDRYQVKKLGDDVIDYTFDQFSENGDLVTAVHAILKKQSK